MVNPLATHTDSLLNVGGVDKRNGILERLNDKEPPAGPVIKPSAFAAVVDWPLVRILRAKVMVWGVVTVILHSYVDSRVLIVLLHPKLDFICIVEGYFADVAKLDSR